jgi:hypothetical protein
MQPLNCVVWNPFPVDIRQGSWFNLERFQSAHIVHVADTGLLCNTMPSVTVLANRTGTAALLQHVAKWVREMRASDAYGELYRRHGISNARLLEACEVLEKVATDYAMAS